MNAQASPAALTGTAVTALCSSAVGALALFGSVGPALAVPDVQAQSLPLPMALARAFYNFFCCCEAYADDPSNSVGFVLRVYQDVQAAVADDTAAPSVKPCAMRGRDPHTTVQYCLPCYQQLFDCA